MLVLFPMKKNKLLLQWKGPYPVVEKMPAVNYRTKMGNKVKNWHINMLRSYSEREKSKEGADTKTETKVMPESDVVAYCVQRWYRSRR